MIVSVGFAMDPLEAAISTPQSPLPSLIEPAPSAVLPAAEPRPPGPR